MHHLLLMMALVLQIDNRLDYRAIVEKMARGGEERRRVTGSMLQIVLVHFGLTAASQVGALGSPKTYC